MKNLLLYSLLISVSGCSFFGDTEPERSTILKVGKTIPSFIYKTLDGRQRASSDLDGKVVLINFFATWCGPCIQELPHLQNEVYKAINDDDFVLLCFGREHDSQELEAFVKEKNLDLPIYPDPSREIYSLFAEKYIPRNFLIDRQGTVIFSETGFEKDDFNSMISLIQQQLND